MSGRLVDCEWPNDGGLPDEAPERLNVCLATDDGFVEITLREPSENRRVIVLKMSPADAEVIERHIATARRIAATVRSFKETS